jgi:hypothetical protein
MSLIFIKPAGSSSTAQSLPAKLIRSEGDQSCVPVFDLDAKVGQLG